MIGRLLAALRRRLCRFGMGQAGTATIEFVLVVPVTILIFLASVESGYYMMRHAMMERGLDIVMREFRLGRLQTATHDQIRNLVCDATPILIGCRNDLKVWIEQVQTVPWQMPATPAYCGDGNGTLNAAPARGTIDHGASNQLMIVRICTLQKPLFPTTRFTAGLIADSRGGGYQLATATIVVNEPRVGGGS